MTDPSLSTALGLAGTEQLSVDDRIDANIAQLQAMIEDLRGRVDLAVARARPADTLAAAHPAAADPAAVSRWGGVPDCRGYADPSPGTIAFALATNRQSAAGRSRLPAEEIRQQAARILDAVRAQVALDLAEARLTVRVAASRAPIERAVASRTLGTFTGMASGGSEPARHDRAGRASADEGIYGASGPAAPVGAGRLLPRSTGPTRPAVWSEPRPGHHRHRRPRRPLLPRMLVLLGPTRMQHRQRR